MLAAVVVDAEMQRNRQLVRVEVFRVAQAELLKPLVFLADVQRQPLNVAGGDAAKIR